MKPGRPIPRKKFSDHNGFEISDLRFHQAEGLLKKGAKRMTKTLMILALILALVTISLAQKPKPTPRGKPRPAAKAQPEPEPEKETEEPPVVHQEGEVTGTLTVNGQPYQLRYAYAEKTEVRDTKTYKSSEVTKLVLTDRLLSVSELDEFTGREWFSTTLREDDHEPHAITLFITPQGEIVKTHLSVFELDDKDPNTRHQIATDEKRRFKEFKLDGGRVSGKAESNHTTRKGLKWSYAASFNAPLFDPEAEEKPKAESGNRVIGTLTLGDKTIKFTNVYAYTRKSYNPNWKNPNLILLFTDREIADDEFDLDVEIPKLAAAGGLHAIEIEVDGDSRKNVGSHYGANVDAELYYEGATKGVSADSSLMEYRGVKNVTQSERVIRVRDDGKVVEGIVYSRLLHGDNARGRHIKWLYEAKFRAQIRNTEQAGKPLPPGGGVIGKAYFDSKKRMDMSSIDPREMIHFTNPRVVRGFQQGNRATLTIQDREVVYTIRMILDGGKWKPVSEKITDVVLR
jgi:hypothetical protein